MKQKLFALEQSQNQSFKNENSFLWNVLGWCDYQGMSQDFEQVKGHIYILSVHLRIVPMSMIEKNDRNEEWSLNHSQFPT